MFFKVDIVVFYCWDNELIDWMYSFDVILVCSVNLVDIEILGVEVIVIKCFESVDVVVSYIYLDKFEDYWIDEVDVSFYVFNYLLYCVIFGVVWFVIDMVEVCIDNEWWK